MQGNTVVIAVYPSICGLHKLHHLHNEIVLVIFQYEVAEIMYDKTCL